MIRGYNAAQVEAIKQAIRKVIELEGLGDDLPPLVEDASAGGLISRTNPKYPVIISRVASWSKSFEAMLRAAAERANGQPCELRFEWDDAD